MSTLSKSEYEIRTGRLRTAIHFVISLWQSDDRKNTDRIDIEYINIGRRHK